MVKYRLGDIQPNPFRQFEHNPLRSEKIDALRVSIRECGFWDNIVARINEQGLPQIAHGHHRLAALREDFPPDHEIGLILRDGLNDAGMIKFMAHENMEAYRADFVVTMEIVRSVVEAYADGKIALDPVTGRHDQFRYAPFFGLGLDGVHPVKSAYTSETVRKFLGWGKTGKDDERVRYALQALEIVALGLKPASIFTGKSLWEARPMVRALTQAHRDMEEAGRYQEVKGARVAEQGGPGAEQYAADSAARAASERDVGILQEIGDNLAAGLNEGKLAVADIPKAAQAMREDLITQTARDARKARRPSLSQWVNQLCASLGRFLGGDKDTAFKQLARLLEDDGEGQANICHLSQQEFDRIVESIHHVHDRLDRYLKRMEKARASVAQPAPAPTVLRLARPTTGADSRRVAT